MEDATLNEGKEIVSVPKAQLTALVERLEKLEKGAVTVRPKRVTEHTAFVRFLDGHPVMGFSKKVPWTVIEDGKEVMYAEVMVKKDKEIKPVTVEYLKFLNECPKVRAKIVSQKAIPTVSSQGVETPRDIKNDQFKTGETIDLIVTSVDYLASVEILEGEHEGETLEIGAKGLNL